MKSQRSIKNVFVRPGAQIRFIVLFSVGAVVIFSIAMMGLISILYSNFIATASAFNFPDEVAASLRTSLRFAIFAIAGCGGGLALVMISAGVSLSHRIFGPLVPLQTLISKLSNADFTARGSLRKDDYLRELMESLNKMASSLEEREARLQRTDTAKKDS